MGWLDKLVGIPDPAKTIEAVGGALDKLFTSKEEKLTHKELMERIKQRPQEAQWAINQTEAGHRTIFVAGWRPFIGWVCGLGLANTFLVNPWIQWITSKAGPTLPQDIMLELVLALLGLGALRTLEKSRGVAK